MTDSLPLVEIIDQTSLVSDIVQPLLPSCCPIPNGSLRPGSLITIYATAPTKEGRFRIDLYASNCQHVRVDGKSVYNPVERIIAFHFNARFSEGPDGTSYLLMNSYHAGKWDQDERSQEFPFVPNQSFCLMILTQEDRFKIYVNGGVKPLYEFRHRFHIGDIARLHIEGPNLAVELVEFRELTKFSAAPKPHGSTASELTIEPIPNELVEGQAQISKAETSEKMVVSPTIPYFEYEPNLSKPCDIYITGSILDPFSKYFVINLAHTVGQRDAKKHNIPMHISIRAKQEKVIRNSLLNGTWGQEETDFEGPFELKPGSNFEMLIQNQNDLVLIIINGQRCCEYKHRNDPKIIDTMEINGSVALHSIRYVLQA